MTRTHEVVLIKSGSLDRSEIRRQACAEVKRKLKINSYLHVVYQTYIKPYGHIVIVALPHKNPRIVWSPNG